MSREKQIEEMAKVLCKNALTEYCASGRCSNQNCLVNAKALETLYNAGYRKQSEWISVDERLPHSQQMVIGYTPCDGYMFVGFYQKVDSPYWKSYWSVITAMRSTKKITKKVTHWMPLPEAPKKGGAE